MCLCACQVTGLDGNYRITCHTVMEVLREHRDSVMAVLEAFVYDPLLNWRLMDSKDLIKLVFKLTHTSDSISVLILVPVGMCSKKCLLHK